MNFAKKRTSIFGEVAFPLQVGKRASIYGAHYRVILTSTVVSIWEVNTQSVVFETMNTVYTVSLAPAPEPVSAGSSTALMPWDLAVA